MFKPHWAITGAALLGTASVVGAVIVASPGGEEEVVQESNPAPVETCIPLGSRPIDCVSPEQYADFCSRLSCQPPPTLPFNCIYVVVDGEAPCLPLTDPRFADLEKCNPVPFGDRAACLPTGATSSFVLGEYTVAASPLWPKEFAMVTRGNSIIRYADTVFEYYVAPEDEADFRALKELFLPGGATPPPAPYPYSCRYIVTNGELACLPLDNPAVRACYHVEFHDRSACAPEGANVSLESMRVYNPAIGDTADKGYTVIRRGNSLIKYNPYDDAPIEYTVAAEDKDAFRGVEALFSGAQPNQ